MCKRSGGWVDGCNRLCVFGTYDVFAFFLISMFWTHTMKNNDPWPIYPVGHVHPHTYNLQMLCFKRMNVNILKISYANKIFFFSLSVCRIIETIKCVKCDFFCSMVYLILLLDRYTFNIDLSLELSLSLFIFLSFSACFWLPLPKPKQYW